MLQEIWSDIPGFSFYQVSNMGRVISYRNDKPLIMHGSDDGNGYLKLMLYGDDGRRYCKKIHRLVAEAFIPCPESDEEMTVDHIQSGPEGKLDNSVTNLQWITRSENIKKAYRDGMCDERIQRQNKVICITNLWTGNYWYIDSIGQAAELIGVDRSSISHCLRGDVEKVKNFTFEYASDYSLFEDQYDDPDSGINDFHRLMDVINGI